MTLPGWVLAIFVGMAAAVPAGVYFTAGIGDEEHGLFGIITED